MIPGFKKIIKFYDGKVTLQTEKGRRVTFSLYPATFYTAALNSGFMPVDHAPCEGVPVVKNEGLFIAAGNVTYRQQDDPGRVVLKLGTTFITANGDCIHGEKKYRIETQYGIRVVSLVFDEAGKQVAEAGYYIDQPFDVLFFTDTQSAVVRSVYQGIRLLL